jgi:hypothetical protein
MAEMHAVKDVSIGDHIQVKGFEDPLMVRSAKKVQKGTDAGKLEVKLAGSDGNLEIVLFDPEEAVMVVGKDPDARQTTVKPARKAKGKPASKAKASPGQPKAPKDKATRGQARTRSAPAEEGTPAASTPAPEVEPEPAENDIRPGTAVPAEAPPTAPTAAEAPQAGNATPELAPAEVAPAEANLPAEPTATATSIPDPTQPGTKAQRGKGKKAQPAADGKPAKLSALDAAARVLGETGQAMSCSELIGAMAAKGYWISPGGKTPAGTLYSALLRELQAKGDKARFVKAARGQFALRQPQG